jgi:hypothetical protein
MLATEINPSIGSGGTQRAGGGFNGGGKAASHKSASKEGFSLITSEKV